MHTTNFQHYLDERGNIPTDMPQETRQMGHFLALLIDDASSGDYDAEPTVSCINKGCEGLIVAFINNNNPNEIYWVCPICKSEGLISNWRGTKWDNSQI